MYVFFIPMMHFYGYKFLKMGKKGNVCPFISMALFYSYKFTNIGTCRKCVSLYFYGSFL